MQRYPKLPNYARSLEIFLPSLRKKSRQKHFNLQKKSRFILFLRTIIFDRRHNLCVLIGNSSLNILYIKKKHYICILNNNKKK